MAELDEEKVLFRKKVVQMTIFSEILGLQEFAQKNFFRLRFWLIFNFWVWWQKPVEDKENFCKNDSLSNWLNFSFAASFCLRAKKNLTQRFEIFFAWISCFDRGAIDFYGLTYGSVFVLIDYNND